MVGGEGTIDITVGTMANIIKIILDIVVTIVERFAVEINPLFFLDIALSTIVIIVHTLPLSGD